MLRSENAWGDRFQALVDELFCSLQPSVYILIISSTVWLTFSNAVNLGQLYMQYWSVKRVHLEGMFDATVRTTMDETEICK